MNSAVLDLGQSGLSTSLGLLLVDSSTMLSETISRGSLDTPRRSLINEKDDR